MFLKKKHKGFPLLSGLGHSFSKQDLFYKSTSKINDLQSKICNLKSKTSSLSIRIFQTVSTKPQKY